MYEVRIWGTYIYKHLNYGNINPPKIRRKNRTSKLFLLT